MLKDKLRKARKDAGLTQKQVAVAIGVTESAYCGYETGKRQPDALKIKQIAQVLGISGDYLLDIDAADSAQDGASLTFDDFTYAMHGASGDLTDRDKQLLLDMANQLAAANRERKKNASGENID